MASFSFPSFSEDPLLCPVHTLKSYKSATGSLRGEQSRLFISFIKPHKPVSSSLIARWLKAMLELAGINTSIFKLHSTRGTSASAAARMDITTKRQQTGAQNQYSKNFTTSPQRCHPLANQSSWPDANQNSLPKSYEDHS